MSEDSEHSDFEDELKGKKKKTSKSRKRNRSKVSVEWTEELTTKLICAVEVQDLLWNAGHKDYKNRALRNTAWSEMSENIFDGEFDAAQLNAKWSNLRIQFKSYYAKNKQTKSGQEAGQNKVYWKYYNSMMFVMAAEEKQTAHTESNLVSMICI